MENIPAPSPYDVLILGAGLGGIGMASRLKAAGVANFIVIEKAATAGGTWRENVYPGAACDTESHLYCYSFSLHLGVSRLYARQPELLAYANRLIDEHGLASHIRYGTEIVSATWDDTAGRWQIGLENGETLLARTFIPAWGQLNRPAEPEIPGREIFAGQAFHSAHWPQDLELAGKRVASIGNAASAIQYIPAVAQTASALSVFQRSPNWIVPRGDRPYDATELAGYETDPDSFRANQAALFAWRETTFLRMREGSEDALELERQAREHLATQIREPTLRAKLTPDFPLGCKRVLRSDDYFPALERDNVTLVTDPIVEFVADGIVTADGTVHPFDVVIFGTGFETQSFQGPVDIYGVGGCSLRDAWREGARAYLGLSVPHFPNMFLIYGPNTNLGHNSILSMFEIQFAYIVAALHALQANPAISLDVRAPVAEQFDADLQAEMAGSAWAGSCTSWYKNAAGRVVNNWSGPVEAYRAAAQFDSSDYVHRFAAIS